MPAPGLPRILTDRYRLDRLLGEGGMATVYVATDLKHDRAVALKMMREPMASALGEERFLREIAVTAQLDHPHVVPLLDSGAVDGELFYVMPLVEGESLRDRLTREKQLSLDTALSITNDVLDALEYAHARGIIHRDIKPENILLSGSHARVADFGVARAVAASGGDTLTGTGVALGTPAYMSPEQGAADRNIDRRSDVYAVGCVLYEMLAGQPPFTGPTSESIVRQHLIAPPLPVTQLRPTVPASIATSIERALSKAPADRFDSAAVFAAALADAARTASAAPSAPSSTRTPDIALTDTRPLNIAPPRRRAIVMLGALVVLAVASVGIRSMQRPAAAPAERPLVAVLPFTNLSGPAEEYFADGVTDEITTKLTRISGIRVVSRQTALRYRNTELSPRQIARELGVQYVLQGTVRTDRLADGSGRVRVNPQLVRAADEANLWTDGLTVPLAIGAMFDAQARIAENVADAFNVVVLKPEIEALRRRETQNMAAYDAYRLGRYQFAKGAPAAVREAIGYFEHAISLDSNYARPYADLAAAYLMIPYFPLAWMPQQEAFANAEAAARRALSLDPDLAAAHSSLGEVMAQGYWRWEEADLEQRRAIALDPEAAEPRFRRSEVLSALGRRSEALAEAEKALQLEPTSPHARRILAFNLADAGRLDEATTLLEESLQLVPSFLLARVALAEFAAAKGDLVGMGGQLSQLPGMEAIGTAMTEWAQGTGPRSDAVRAVDALRSANQPLDDVRKAWLYANIGETALALDALERATAVRAPTSAFLFRFPSVVRALAQERRFQTLMASTGVQAATTR